MFATYSSTLPTSCTVLEVGPRARVPAGKLGYNSFRVTNCHRRTYRAPPMPYASGRDLRRITRVKLEAQGGGKLHLGVRCVPCSGTVQAIYHRARYVSSLLNFQPSTYDVSVSSHAQNTSHAHDCLAALAPLSPRFSPRMVP